VGLICTSPAPPGCDLVRLVATGIVTLAELVVPLSAVGRGSLEQVGGKNASLGELIRELGPEGIAVPPGFALTVAAYRLLLAQSGPHAGASAGDELAGLFAALDPHDLGALQRAGAAARALLLAVPLPQELVQQVLQAYRQLGGGAVAVRSSATAEDLPKASFAGQQETLLNIEGETALLAALRRCYASLFTDRAIAYRAQHGFGQLQVGLSIGVQRLVRSDLASAGVMFSLDTETGFRDAVLINAAYGLGENVVQGVVSPDEVLVFKPTLAQGYAAILSKRLGSKARRLVLAEPGGSPPVRNTAVSEAEQGRFALSDAEILQLARWAVRIEQHYGTAMDIEWAKDGISGELFIVQARPETVQTQRNALVLRSWHLEAEAEEIVRGRAIGTAISSGRARLLDSPAAMQAFESGDLLVTRRTDPDWEPILRLAAGVVTDEGGRTCHAAIIAREMGITAIVGTADGTRRISDGEPITLSCAEGDEGRVYRGALPFRCEEQQLDQLPETRTRLHINVGNPEEAFRLAALPCDGVGLARLEFIIANHIGVHPLALLQPQRVRDPAEREAIAARVSGYGEPAAFYVERLVEGMARIAAAFYPRPVVLRFSDFKSNEYARLLGGSGFEPQEENPMLGWRGASRYSAPEFGEAFGLECRALKRVREQLGLTNLIAMVPFCRTPAEADRVLAAMARHGLVRGENGLQVYVMVELPSNVIAAEAFAERFDGFSIGSNDLTQLILGLDRDSARVADLFDEADPAVLQMIRLAIETAHRCGRPIGICGQAPSDNPAFTRFLLEQGIDSISLNPDAFIRARLQVAAAEQALGLGPVAAPAGPTASRRAR
jgi:pyruvate,water dikinase